MFSFQSNHVALHFRERPWSLILWNDTHHKWSILKTRPSGVSVDKASEPSNIGTAFKIWKSPWREKTARRILHFTICSSLCYSL
jgi:hypothetical protein